MPTMDDNPKHWREIIIEAGALIWMDNQDNWKQWEREMRFRWWKAHILVTDLTKSQRSIIGPGQKPR